MSPQPDKSSPALPDLTRAQVLHREVAPLACKTLAVYWGDRGTLHRITLLVPSHFCRSFYIPGDAGRTTPISLFSFVFCFRVLAYIWPRFWFWFARTLYPHLFCSAWFRRSSWTTIAVSFLYIVSRGGQDVYAHLIESIETFFFLHSMSILLMHNVAFTCRRDFPESCCCASLLIRPKFSIQSRARLSVLDNSMPGFFDVCYQKQAKQFTKSRLKSQNRAQF